jgi:branched-chain amino acid transport system substrate-binding protein
VRRTHPLTWAKVLAGTAALALSLAACGSTDSSTPEAADPGASSESSSETTESSVPVDDTFTNAKCKKEDGAESLRVGGLLPLTGRLSFLGPPMVSGVGLAVSDINAAGGVNGSPACHDIQDENDTSDLAVSSASTETLIASKPSFIVGAASSGISLSVVDQISDNKIVMVSPSNTSDALSGISDYYFRTAPPDVLQGYVNGQLIASDGFQKIAFLVFNDPYGTGLRDKIQSTVEDGGGECVYGCKGDGDEFPAGQTTFSTEVNAAITANPDAIVIVTYDEVLAIVPELSAQGWDMSKTYFVDGNVNDYSKDFKKGIIEGAQGTVPGVDAAQEFKDRVNGWAESIEGTGLDSYTYAAESYDATILAALAAVKGGATDPETIKANLPAVNGSTDGTECATFAECAELLADGEEIHYRGPSGIGPFNDQNDPGRAFVGIYAFDDKNVPQFVTMQEGTI